MLQPSKLSASPGWLIVWYDVTASPLLKFCPKLHLQHPSHRTEEFTLTERDHSIVNMPSSPIVSMLGTKSDASLIPRVSILGCRIQLENPEGKVKSKLFWAVISIYKHKMSGVVSRNHCCKSERGLNHSWLIQQNCRQG